MRSLIISTILFLCYCNAETVGTNVLDGTWGTRTDEYYNSDFGIYYQGYDLQDCFAAHYISFFHFLQNGLEEENGYDGYFTFPANIYCSDLPSFNQLGNKRLPFKINKNNSDSLTILDTISGLYSGDYIIDVKYDTLHKHVILTMESEQIRIVAFREMSVEPK